MPRSGTKNSPLTLRVNSMERAEEVARICDAHGWHFVTGIEPNEPEDLSDLEQKLNPPLVVNAAEKVGRNEPCTCGSGLKYKKCCLTRELNP